MGKIKLNHRGFIIILLDTLTGGRISAYAGLCSWKDAVAYATDLLRLKQYSSCVLCQMAKCVGYGKNM